MSKAQKPLHLLMGGGDRSLGNCIDLSRVHLDVVSRVHKPIGGDRGDMKLTFLGLNKELVVEGAALELAGHAGRKSSHLEKR